MASWKEWALRALVDAGVLLLMGALVLVVLFAWHGQQAYAFLQQVQAQNAQQQAAQQRAAPKQP